MGQCASDHQGVIRDTNCPPIYNQILPTAIWVNVQATTRAWSGILTAPPSTTRSFHRYMGQCASDHQGVIRDATAPPPSTTRSFHRYMGQCASDHQGVIRDTNCPPHLQPDPSTAIWVNVQATTRAWSGILTAPPPIYNQILPPVYMGQCASDHQGVIKTCRRRPKRRTFLNKFAPE